MITNFNSKMFIFKNISNFFVIFLAYFMLSGNPILTINNGVDLIPQINVRELINFVMGRTISFAYLGTSLTFLCSTIFNAFISQCVLFDNTDFSCYSNECLNFDSNAKFFVLDFSNPFLYGCKTNSLRE